MGHQFHNALMPKAADAQGPSSWPQYQQAPQPQIQSLLRPNVAASTSGALMDTERDCTVLCLDVSVLQQLPTAHIRELSGRGNENY